MGAPPRSRGRLAGALLGVCALLGSASTASAFVWPNVPDQVAAALDATDPAERRLAVRQLPRLPRALAEPLVRKALADADVEVRLAAASVAAGMRLARGGELVIGWLNESDARLRLAACELVRASPTDHAVAALGRVLADADASVRVAAAAAMGASASVEATSPLLGHLDDPSPEVRAEVARALGRLGDARAVLPLVGKVQDGVPEVRRAALRALGELADARATVAVTMALADNAQAVRVDALGALARIRSDDATFAIAALVEGLSEATLAAPLPGATGTPASDPGTAEVRRAAIRALGQIGSPRAVEVLLGELAKEEAGTERPVVRQALVASGTVAVAPLTSLLGATLNAQAASGAALALGELGAGASRGAVVRAMERGVLPLRHGLVALGAMGDGAALPWVLERLDDPDPLVRREAVRAATRLVDPSQPDGRPVEPARVALTSEDTPTEERIALVRLLGRTGADSARGLLLPLVVARSNSLRLAAIEALGTLARPEPAVDRALLFALGDDVPPVRLAAALALARCGSGALVAPLAERLEQAAEQDRGALGLALSGVLARADEGAVRVVEHTLEHAAEPVRDALIEGLGRMRSANAGRALAALAKGSIDDRRKVAEALGAHATAELATLRALAADVDASVRANAAWSLGEAPAADVTALLTALLADADGAVASNAAAALGRAAARSPDAGGPPVASALLGALADGRPYVRANALAALARAGLSPESPAARELVLSDAAAAVRTAAATWLHRGAAQDPAARRALARCASEDRDGAVATRCAAPLPASRTTDDVTILVVPDGRTEPQPRGVFVLERADGLLRLGTADRRGAVFERATPSGTLRLLPPALLAR